MIKSKVSLFLLNSIFTLLAVNFQLTAMTYLKSFYWIVCYSVGCLFALTPSLFWYVAFIDKHYGGASISLSKILKLFFISIALNIVGMFTLLASLLYFDELYWLAIIFMTLPNIFFYLSYGKIYYGEEQWKKAKK